MGLNIIDGQIIEIKGLTWNNKKVYHYQNLIPSIDINTPFDLGIGNDIDRLTYKLIGERFEDVVLELSYNSSNVFKIALSSSSTSVSKVTGSFTYDGITNTFDTSIPTTFTYTPGVNNLSFSNVTVLKINNIQETVADFSVVISSSNDETNLGFSPEEIIGETLLGKTETINSDITGSDINSILYIDTNGFLVVSQANFTIKNTFIQIQFTRTV